MNKQRAGKHRRPEESSAIHGASSQAKQVGTSHLIEAGPTCSGMAIVLFKAPLPA